MKLAEAEIETNLVTTQGWTRKGDEIGRQYEFKDFAESMKFVNRVAELAEAANHHPDITISWNKVSLSLSTHSEGGLTNKDFALARRIDAL